ncbi:ASCH domain-containing protein [Urbifossiella limnaea]|uniref:ASCH domain protein n=1 Tax=Urbifossiella limnaea TaxID=2528023 RepID=A0A517XYA1_9BACT|nr:ASCH domain-containing protein [Urbifossiella limnaea]QDU22496.1 ASCH domain protein [Urbifossiella limnaea]
MSNAFALSVKQPWAALLVAGVKLVEVRTWATRRRGRVLIHAGLVPDDRPQAWEQVTTPELEEAARQRGGIVGEAELVGCRTYDSADAFAADAGRHLNDPGWFAPPRLHGFEFRAARPLPFRRLPGFTMFFRVPDSTAESPGTAVPGL